MFKIIETTIFYFALITLILSCGDSNNKTNKLQISTPLHDYLKFNLPTFSVVDSLQLRSINSTIYFINDTKIIDDNDYFIIRDNSSKQLYKIVHSYWPIFNGDLPQDLQLRVLENDEEGKIIEPVNYIFIGLESFLNECVALEKQELNPNVVDTIIRFYDKELIRLTLPTQIDTLLNRCKPYDKQNKAEFKKFIELKRSILKNKIGRRNVLLYSLPLNWEDYSRIYFFEINPGLTDYSSYPTMDAKRFKLEKMFYPREACLCTHLI